MVWSKERIKINTNPHIIIILLRYWLSFSLSIHYYIGINGIMHTSLADLPPPPSCVCWPFIVHWKAVDLQYPFYPYRIVCFVLCRLENIVNWDPQCQLNRHLFPTDTLNWLYLSIPHKPHQSHMGIDTRIILIGWLKWRLTINSFPSRKSPVSSLNQSLLCSAAQ